MKILQYFGLIIIFAFCLVVMVALYHNFLFSKYASPITEICNLAKKGENFEIFKANANNIAIKFNYIEIDNKLPYRIKYQMFSLPYFPLNFSYTCSIDSDMSNEYIAIIHLLKD